MKVFPLVLLVSLSACSSDDRSVGNGPGDADGRGGRVDPPSADESVGSAPKVVAQADQQRTRERPDASSAEEPSRTQPTVPAGADRSSQATRPGAATNSRTDPLANSESAATKLGGEGDKSRDAERASPSASDVPRREPSP